MKRNNIFSNFFFQFILIALTNFGLGGILLLISMLLGYQAKPLEASNDFVFYDNILESFLAVMIIHFYRKYSFFDKQKTFLNYLVLGLFLYLGKGFLAFLSLNNHHLDYKLNDLLFNLSPSIAFRLNLVWAGLFAYYWIENEQKGQQQFLLKELELAQMKELKTQSDLEALQAKINPHFLYNSLNSIANSIEDEPQKAKHMTLLLSKFFRFSTNSQSQYFWSLNEELDLVKTYLSIEKIRFGERLDFTISVLNSSLSACLIPRFLIQPLIENAIKHGISKTINKGILGIKVTDNESFILLKIYDNGLPFESGFQQGYGLRSVHEKIKLLGGEGASFEIFDEPSVGFDDYHSNPSKYILIKLPKKFNL